MDGARLQIQYFDLYSTTDPNHFLYIHWEFRLFQAMIPFLRLITGLYASNINRIAIFKYDAKQGQQGIRLRVQS